MDGGTKVSVVSNTCHEIKALTTQTIIQMVIIQTCTRTLKSTHTQTTTNSQRAVSHAVF